MKISDFPDYRDADPTGAKMFGELASMASVLVAGPANLVDFAEAVSSASCHKGNRHRE